MPNNSRPNGGRTLETSTQFQNITDTVVADMQETLDQEAMQEITALAEQLSVRGTLASNQHLDDVLRALQISLEVQGQQVPQIVPTTAPTAPVFEPRSNFPETRVMPFPFTPDSIDLSDGLPPGRLTSLLGIEDPPPNGRSTLRERLTERARQERNASSLSEELRREEDIDLALRELSDHTSDTDMPIDLNGINVPAEIVDNRITLRDISTVTTWESLKAVYLQYRRMYPGADQPFYGSYVQNTYKKYFNALTLLRNIALNDFDDEEDELPCTRSTFSVIAKNNQNHGLIRCDNWYTSLDRGQVSGNRIILSEAAATFLFGTSVNKRIIQESFDFFRNCIQINTTSVVEKITTARGNVSYVISLGGNHNTEFSNHSSRYYLGSSHLPYQMDNDESFYTGGHMTAYQRTVEWYSQLQPYDNDSSILRGLETTCQTNLRREPIIIPFYNAYYNTHLNNFQDRSVRTVAPRAVPDHTRRTSMPTAIHEHEQNWLNERREIQRLTDQERNRSSNQYYVDSYQISAYVQNAYRYSENTNRLPSGVTTTVTSIVNNICPRPYNTWNQRVNASYAAGIETLNLSEFTRHGFHYLNEDGTRAYAFRFKREALEQTFVVGNRGPNRNRTRINREIKARVEQINVMLQTFGAKLTTKLHTLQREGQEDKVIRIFLLEGMPDNGSRYTEGVNPITERLRLEREAASRGDSIAMPTWFTADLNAAIPILNFISVDEVQDIRPLVEEISQEPAEWTVMETQTMLADQLQATVSDYLQVAQDSSPWSRELLTGIETSAMSYLSAMMAGRVR